VIYQASSDRCASWRTPAFNNKDAQQLFEGFERFTELNQTGTAALVDCFPILRSFPDWILPVKREAKVLHDKEKILYMKHWMKCKKEIENGKSNNCFCLDMAKTQQVEGFSDDLASYIAGSLLEAGSDTTSSTLYGFIQAMVVFPEVQRKAQAEIDRVVGPDRLPTMEDEPQMQYIRGCVKETLRWMPSAILAFPHAVTQDDYYHGYKLPLGAGVISNVYTINMDPTRYPEPRNFDPDRYKDDYQTATDAASNPDVQFRDHFTFGAGRRICQGMHVAEHSLFLGIALMIWAFDFAPEKNEEGIDIVPNIENLTQGFVCRPENFRATITPRSDRKADIVRRDWKEAKELLLDSDTLQWLHIPDENEQ
jgi:cytochrome P450